MATEGKERANEEFPDVVDRAARKRSTKEQARMRQEGVIERVWKDAGGNQDKIPSIGECECTRGKYVKG